ncbi:MAG: hypothetical protein HYR48_06445 [Gemmatimonadetes bacterium]|nr:hypothetical protein [Gemmatimonadota bacterium]
MRRLLVGVAACSMLASPVRAQGLRDQISQLFIFGAGQEPLFLGGTADPSNPATIQVHGNHFVPAAAAGNGTIISFITNAISGNVADFPFSAASGGTTFRFEGGAPVRTSISPGPVFAERAQTLGRGRTLVGVSYNSFHYKTLRGVDLDNLQLIFTHANVDTDACDSIVGSDCAPMGVPTLENDIMPFTLSLDVDVALASFVLTYGLSDRLDVGVALPIVSTSLRGHSEAQIIPFGGPTAAHFFAGTPSNPVLGASRFVEGSATGLGDVALRMKLNVRHSAQTSLALLVDGRFPTGSERDLLGAGKFSGRLLGVLSSRAGAFSPHANFGYLLRSGTLRDDAVVATLGFDHVLAPWATLAVDLVSQLQVGDGKLVVPGTVTIERPFRRTVRPSTIPDSRDDLVNGSFGFKFTTGPGPTIVANTIWPLNRGGLRANVLWTLGLEYNF